jgi:O-antigen ligase
MRMKATAPVLIARSVLFFICAVVSCGILWLLSDELTSWDGIQTAVVALLLLISVFVAETSTPPTNDPTRASFRCALVLWVALFISEELFNRSGGNADSAMHGRFSASAYGELTLWVLVFAIVVMLTLRSPSYLTSITSSKHKWFCLFVVFCIGSSLYAPRLSFSIAWAFKLFVITLVLTMCARFIRDERDLLAFVRATFWGCAFLICSAIYTAIADPSIGFEDGRLGQSPTSLSVQAGALLALALTLRPLGVSAWATPFTAISAIVMILGGGKAGIVGGVMSATLIYGLKKQLGSALALLSGLAGLGVILLLASSGLNSYFHNYADAGLGSNLTGRTGIWDAAIPAIQNRLLLGHGYMASRFVSYEIGSTGEGMWEADHMHNAFLDVLYNSGVIGFSMFLMMHVIIIRALVQVIRKNSSTQADDGVFQGIAAGALAIYTNLIINAFFNAIIGGRPSSLYMLFMAIFVLAHTLQRLQLRRPLTYDVGEAQLEHSIASPRPRLYPTEPFAIP